MFVSSRLVDSSDKFDILHNVCMFYYVCLCYILVSFFFQAEDGIRDTSVTGVRRVLFRSNAQQHLEAVRAVHAACPDASILVDPNQAWSIELLNELAPELHALGVVLIEQPLPAGAEADLGDYRGPVPLAADESCADVASLRALSPASRYD